MQPVPSSSASVPFLVHCDVCVPETVSQVKPSFLSQNSNEYSTVGFHAGLAPLMCLLRLDKSSEVPCGRMCVCGPENAYLISREFKCVDL